MPQPACIFEVSFGKVQTNYKVECRANALMAPVTDRYGKRIHICKGQEGALLHLSRNFIVQWMAH
jgi:hypothetical protein